MSQWIDHYDKFVDNRTPMDFNQNDSMPPREDVPLDNNSMFGPNGNGSFDIKPMDLNIPNNSSMNLRDNNFTNRTGELMDDVVSNLIGLNNIAPKIKDDKKNMTNPPEWDNKNASAPQVPGDKNSSNMWSDSIKDNKDSKVVKKSNSKKVTKKSNKKVKNSKKAKTSKKSKTSKKAKSSKKSKKGMAKL